MARNKNTRSQISAGRGLTTPTANVSLPLLFNPVVYSKPLQIARSNSIDNRFYHPLPKKSQQRMNYERRTIFGTSAPISTKINSNLSVNHQFTQPQITTPCVRRKQRKQVMHALNLAGRKFGSGKSYRRNSNSFIKC